MALSVVYHDGFDRYATAHQTLLYDIKTGTIDVLTGGRNSGQRARVGTTGSTTPACYVRKAVPSFTEFVMGGALLLGSGELTGAADFEVFSVLESATYHMSLRVRGAAGGASHDIKVYRGATQLATSAAYLTQGVWHWIEFACKINDTTGYYRVWVDGVQLFDDPTEDTQNAGTGTCDRYQLGLETRTGNNQRYYLDDTYFATVTSGPDNIGDCREAVLVADGAGNQVDFTPSASTNQSNVDDATPDDDSTYNHSVTVSDIDLFTLGALPSDGTVYSVKQMLYARKEDAGTRSMRQVLRTNSTNFEGTTKSLSDSYQFFTDQYALNPDTGNPWTSSEINALEAGYKVQA